MAVLYGTHFSSSLFGPANDLLYGVHADARWSDLTSSATVIKGNQIIDLSEKKYLSMRRNESTLPHDKLLHTTVIAYGITCCDNWEER